jgi:hypothetical protein
MDAPRPSLRDEYREFLAAHKRWWLACFVVLGVLLAVLVILGNTNISPFVYTLY